MRHRAFGLIELIGVLAIVAILTAVVLPRLSRRAPRPDVVQTVHGASVTQTVVAIHALQTATLAHLAQFGSLASVNGTPLVFVNAYDQFDKVLLKEGLIERPFDARLGTNAVLRLQKVSGMTATDPIDCSSGAFDLDGDGRSDVSPAAMVLEAVIPGVAEPDARSLNDQLDGPQLGSTPGQSDLLGRVIYPQPGPDGRTEVHIYIMHR